MEGTKSLFFVGVAVLIVMLPRSLHALPFTGKPGVGIQDYTGGNIEVHCLSKDTDFTPRNMKDKEIWTWYFHPDIGGDTLWRCGFIWNTPDKKTHTATFSVWNIIIVNNYDKSIMDWRVQPDGFYIYDEVKFLWKKTFHNWDDPPSMDIVELFNHTHTGGV